MGNSPWGSAESEEQPLQSPSGAHCRLPVRGVRGKEKRETVIVRHMSFQPQERGPPTLTGGLLESEAGQRGLSAESGFAAPVSSTQGLPPRWVFLAFASTRELSGVGLLLSFASSAWRSFQPGFIRVTAP